MKVLLVTTSFPQISNPNSGFFIKQLVDNFSNNIETIVVTPADVNKPFILRHKRLTQVNFSYAPSRFRILAHAPGGLSDLKGKRIAIIFLPLLIAVEFLTIWKWSKGCDLIHANWSINGVIASLVGKIAKKPVITTLRGSDINKAKRSIVFEIILKLCLRMSDRVNTVSESLADQILRNYSWYHSEIPVIENGVEGSFLKINQRLLSKEQITTILIIGNLTKNKSVDTLIYALSEISSAKFKVEIVGDGPEREELEKLSEQLGMSRSITFHGSVNTEERIKYFNGSSVLAFASRSEGRPNVVIEAMAAGLAIVASRIEGVVDLVEENKSALMFEPGNPSDAAEKIAKVIENDELRYVLGRNARETIIDRGLTWKRAADKYERLYAKVLDHTGD